MKIHSSFCLSNNFCFLAFQSSVISALGRQTWHALPATSPQPAADQPYQGHLACPTRQVAEATARAGEGRRTVQALQAR